MWLLLVVAGIVGLVLPSHFQGQHALGLALVSLAAALLLIQLLVVKPAVSSFRRGSRRRRGF